MNAARYIAAATTDSRFLTDALRPGVFAADQVGREADMTERGAASGDGETMQSGSEGNDARSSAHTWSSAPLIPAPPPRATTS
ncbi:hypothetical protein [Corynebacterium sp. HMSC28B08]|uniref:hypothetical protein n=1 Tax=Corynebacterium sp. HMSC28B08 TaxID=1581066 RepID=UPI0008A3F81E|nr:hypothetical protein [Corynebacterium sp. HMSC28B08]OFT86831.1 hypothetical protein HMPREF3098_10565 [Corynebacterium sp. HMSC28B08]